MTQPIPVPRPSYSQARENLVNAISPRILCLLACGGEDCRYEGPACWRLNQQAIRGVFSSWVTDDIIAMARPSKYLIEKYNIIEQFQRFNIKSVISMQIPGEHSFCGPPLDRHSGFTYSPQTFMDNDIFFYNFRMPDYSVSSLLGVIDAVKVLAFAVKEGRVAVHCHAGLGRTGVLIACYLIYTLRISPSEAVHYVRIKRPQSIQTRAQLDKVFDFGRMLSTQLTLYPDIKLRYGAPFTLQHYLNRQALLVHGQEARTLRFTPKVVYLVCVRLCCLALGLPAPPEVHTELEKRSAVWALGRNVRETLVSKQYLPLLREKHWGSWVGSVASWEEPGKLSVRKRAMPDKRSYSDSDLSKITMKQELGPYCIPLLGNEKYWSGHYLIRADLGGASPRVTSCSADHLPGNKQIHPPCITMTNNTAKRSQCSVRKTLALTKFSSNVELHRNLHKPGQISVARSVAKAMSDQDSPGDSILQRSALLQEELNSSDCGWALLVTESDPCVLSYLLWTWLEKLKEPVLSTEDVQKLTSGANNKNPILVLKKPQQHTISCLLSCVGTVTRLCPHREDAVLRRMIRALNRNSQEEMESQAALIKIFKTSSRETYHNYSSLSNSCNGTSWDFQKEKLNKYDGNVQKLLKN